MRGDALVNNQRMLAESVFAIADHLQNSKGFAFRPLSVADLPDLPEGAGGMVTVVNDSNVSTWGSVIAGGGSFTVLAFFNGVNWTVIGK